MRSSCFLEMTAIGCTQAVKRKRCFNGNLERKAGAKVTALCWRPKHFLVILVASHTLKTAQDTAPNATIKSLGLIGIYGKSKFSCYFDKLM